MKINILIFSFLMLLAFFAIAAHAFADSTGKNATQLISGDQDVSSLPGQAMSPQASRETQTGQKGKDILAVPVGGKLNTFGNNPKETRTQDLSQTSPVENVTANTTVPAPTQTSAVTEPASVSGVWSLELMDSASHTAVLTLFQSGDAVFGTGNMNLDANTTMVAAASGTLTGNKLNLDLVTLGKVDLYRVMLMVSADSATAAGNYTNYNPNASPSIGTVKGTRSVASS